MIVWCDTETTGLDPREDHLLEVALVVTDDELVEQGAIAVVMKPVGISIDSVKMDPKVFNMHTKNGLLEEIRKMEREELPPVRLHEAEQVLLGFLSIQFLEVPPVESEKCAHCGWAKKEHSWLPDVPGLTLVSGLASDGNCRANGYYGSSFVPKLVPAVSQTPLAGSTIGFDRSFLKQHMPRLEKAFSYRSIDVSSLTEIGKRWSPAIYDGRPREGEESAHRALPDVRVSIDYLRYYRETGFVNRAATPSAETTVERPAWCSNCHLIVRGDHCEECGPPR